MVLKILKTYQYVEILLSFGQNLSYLFINLIYAHKVYIKNDYTCRQSMHYAVYLITIKHMFLFLHFSDFSSPLFCVNVWKSNVFIFLLFIIFVNDMGKCLLSSWRFVFTCQVLGLPMWYKLSRINSTLPWLLLTLKTASQIMLSISSLKNEYNPKLTSFRECPSKYFKNNHKLIRLKKCAITYDKN